MAVHVPDRRTGAVAVALRIAVHAEPVHIAFLDGDRSRLFDRFRGRSAERDVMRRPPRPAESRLLSPAMVGWSLLQGGLALTALAGVPFAASPARCRKELRALMFTSLVLINVGLILVNRSFSSSLVVALRRQMPFCGFCWRRSPPS